MDNEQLLNIVEDSFSKMVKYPCDTMGCAEDLIEVWNEFMNSFSRLVRVVSCEDVLKLISKCHCFLSNLDYKTNNERLDICKDVLMHKSRQYSPTDKLASFKIAARILNITPGQALIGMVIKHIVSLNGHYNGVGETNLEECFTDIHNYLFLLEGMINEQEKSKIE